MTQARAFTRAFSSGEVTSELFGRFDLTKVAQACATMRNFVALPHGPAQNRPGTIFVKEVADSTKVCRLIPFSYNAQQTFAIEMGAGWFRFHTLAETLLHNPAVPIDLVDPSAYTWGDCVSYLGDVWLCTGDSVNALVNPPPATGLGLWVKQPIDGTLQLANDYTEDEIFDVHYTQSADVLTLVHPNHPVHELSRRGAAAWSWSAVSFVSTLAAPTSVAVVAWEGGSGLLFDYVCTAVSADGQESAPSTHVTCNNDLTIAGHENRLSCTAPAGAVRVNWYKLAAGIYGYIGTSDAAVGFVDDNITADVSLNPPSFDATLPTAYPAAVGYFEQRRWFAGWPSGPQNVLATRSGTESDVTYHIPSRSDDRIAFRIAAREGSQVLHIVPVQNLILLSATNEFRIQSVDGGALSGANLSVRPQGYIGASNVQPVVVGSSILYAQSRGGRIGEMAYSQTAQGAYYSTNDLSMLAPHLFDYKRVRDMAFMRSPYPILWCVNDAGALLGMTYVPEQAVAGWHRHDTQGTFESCCVVTEDGEDALYLLTRRTIGGVARRYVERSHSRLMPTQADAYFVDCGLTYQGAAATSVSGLDHLEGQTVAILGDGAVMPQVVVTGGTVSLPTACSTIHVGLPYVCDLQTLPLVIGMPDFGQGRMKNLNQVWLRFRDTSGTQIGPSFDKLTDLKMPTPATFGAPPPWLDDEVPHTPQASWGTSGQVCIRQAAPLPVTVVSATLEVSLGG